MSEMTLTQSQNAAVDAFREFLDGEERVYLLKGAAGTGKTTLLAEFIRIIQQRRRSVHLMAPTGRAAYILGSKTGLPACTIHKGIYSLHNLKSSSQANEDEEDGDFQLKFKLARNPETLSAVYIIDEASMISDNFAEAEAFSFGSGCLLSDMFEYAGTRKIVFVGDYTQLPPVGMNFSPALDSEYLRQKFGVRVREIILREVMRQSGDSVMLSNATKIRDCIERKAFVEFKLLPGPDSKAENDDLLAPYYALSPERPNVKAAVITFSNRQALDYNLAIRRHYYGSAAPRLREGDLLIISRNNYAYEYELFNGNIVQVEACEPDEQLIERNVNVKMGKGRIETVNLRFRRCVIRFAMGSGQAVSLKIMMLDNFLDDVSASIGGALSRALIVDFNNRLPEELKSNMSKIKRLMRSRGPLSMDEQRLVDGYVDRMLKDPYYNAVICKYGYAMTCHKAQGGEWENVFVDMCRYGGTANEAYFRWAYTALTRANKRIWHYRSPDFNYISNIIVEEIKPSAKLKVSNYSADGDFCLSRLKRIQALARERGLTVSEDRSKAYQQIIQLADSLGNSASFQLWYGAQGYSGRDVLTAATSDEFAALCASLIEASFAPDNVPFSAPERPFAEKLVQFIRGLLREEGIRLLDITQERYQDVFHLKTDGIAQIGLTYTAKGNYTYMRLSSSLGSLDQKLQSLRQHFT